MQQVDSHSEVYGRFCVMNGHDRLAGSDLEHIEERQTASQFADETR